MPLHNFADWLRRWGSEAGTSEFMLSDLKLLAAQQHKALEGAHLWTSEQDDAFCSDGKCTAENCGPTAALAAAEAFKEKYE